MDNIEIQWTLKNWGIKHIKIKFRFSETEDTSRYIINIEIELWFNVLYLIWDFWKRIVLFVSYFYQFRDVFEIKIIQGCKKFSVEYLLFGIT